jgi:hypothetical protein
MNIYSRHLMSPTWDASQLSDSAYWFHFDYPLTCASVIVGIINYDRNNFILVAQPYKIATLTFGKL